MKKEVYKKYTKRFYINGAFPTFRFNIYAYWNELMYMIYKLIKKFTP